jgi:restriction system protein
MPIPSIQSLLLPVLRNTADRPPRSVEEIREKMRREFEVTPEELEQKHPKSGTSVFVNRVAWALAHLVMGSAIERIGKGTYRITGRGRSIIKSSPSELTISELH